MGCADYRSTPAVSRGLSESSVIGSAVTGDGGVAGAGARLPLATGLTEVSGFNSKPMPSERPSPTSILCYGHLTARNTAVQILDGAVADFRLSGLEQSDPCWSSCQCRSLASTSYGICTC